MSTTASQIFVRTSDLERLLKSLSSYLQSWSRAVGKSWPDVPFLGNDTARTTRVLPPLGGWCCITDPDPFAVDYQLAQELSTSLGSRAVAVVLHGGELSWRLISYDKGTQIGEELDPPDSLSPDRGNGVMPIYPDATREAIRALQSEGIPQDYWLIRHDDFVEGASTEAQDAFWVDEIITYPQERAPVRPPTRTLFVVKRYQGGVAFRPDIEGLVDNRRRLFAEVRTLYGAPDDRVIDGLLEIERADTNRLLAPFIGCHDSEVPVVQFDYTGPGVPEDDLKQMLKLRRNSFSMSRPTEQQFLRIALGLVASDHMDWFDVKPDRFGIRFMRKPPSSAESQDGADKTSPEDTDSTRTTKRAARISSRKKGPMETRVDLGGPYADYMAGRLAASTPEEAIGSYLSKAEANFDLSSSAGSFEAQADLMLPYIVDPDEGARLEASGVATRPLGHGVRIALSCKVGEGSALVENEDLEKWGVSFHEALRAARANLERSSGDAASRFTEIDAIPGKRLFADMSGDDPASRILLPGLSEVVKDKLGVEEALCAIPDLDSFFIANGADNETRAELRAFARERLMVADCPLTSELFLIRRDSIEEA